MPFGLFCDHTLFISAVASLGWVTPGAATEGVKPLFFPLKTWRPFLLIAVTITIAFYCFHSDVTPSRVGVSYLFYMSDLVSPLFFVNVPTNFFPSGVTPLEGVTRGGPLPPHPSSDATDYFCLRV